MLTLDISEADIQSANYERIHNPVLSIRKRMDAVYWTSQGLSRGDISKKSGVHRNSVRTYIKLYNKGGLDALRSFHYKGSESVLSPHRVTLAAYFKSHPPRSCKEAAARIKELTQTEIGLSETRRFMHQMGMKPIKTGHVPANADPVKQQSFLDDQLMPLIEAAKSGKCHLFFMDAAHFVMLPFLGILWCFSRVFIKAAAGRNRINVLGALNAVTLKIETIVNTDYVNALTIEALLRKLARANPNGLPIVVVLDNARYQHCIFIKELAAELEIKLVFLPPYSPNLNLIERVWRYIKKDVLGTRYFECSGKFHETIKQSLKDINNNKETIRDLKSLLTLNFQTFAQNLIA
jgi:transposase